MDGSDVVSMLWVGGVKLTLPLPPNRANAREHWRVTNRKKKQYYVEAEAALRMQCRWVMDMARGRPRVRAEVPCSEPMRLEATLYGWGKMDRDNLVARLKWPIDCLVRYGLLIDDSEEWLDLQMPKQAGDRKNMRVEIELVPCA